MSVFFSFLFFFLVLSLSTIRLFALRKSLNVKRTVDLCAPCSSVYLARLLERKAKKANERKRKHTRQKKDLEPLKWFLNVQLFVNFQRYTRRFPSWLNITSLGDNAERREEEEEEGEEEEEEEKEVEVKEVEEEKEEGEEGEEEEEEEEEKGFDPVPLRLEFAIVSSFARSRARFRLKRMWGEGIVG
ncbi:hypothetical protein V1478_010860, partial [Vespula squamosa]